MFVDRLLRFHFSGRFCSQIDQVNNSAPLQRVCIMSEVPKEQHELSMEALVGQLGDSAEFSSLRQKVAQISKSKVLWSKNQSKCVEESVGRITSQPTRKTRKKCSFCFQAAVIHRLHTKKARAKFLSGEGLYSKTEMRTFFGLRTQLQTASKRPPTRWSRSLSQQQNLRKRSMW